MYSDGHSYCFSCDTYTPGEGARDAAPREPAKGEFRPVRGEYQPLGKRRLTEETCRKWGYTVGEYRGQIVQIATSRDDTGRPIGQKIRFADKTFESLGAYTDRFYGQHLWGGGGKRVTVTEGELDALSVSQAQGNKWPVVSVPSGAKGAAKVFRKQIQWLESFDEVVLMFDQDEHGQGAAAECAQLLSPGKAKIAILPLKDASDMLQAGRDDEIIKAIWNAKPYRPDGILNGNELWELVSAEDNTPSVPYPWDLPLNNMTLGLRRGELVTLTAGSGIGKSAIATEIGYHLHSLGETVGWLKLEEPVKRTALGILGLHLNKPVHLSREGVSQVDLRRAYDATLGTGRMYLYDHFGSTELDNILARIRFMAVSCGCGWIILDHLSILISGMEDGDERRLIDNAMTALVTLAKELNIGLILISHLKRPSGDKGHEEGAVTSLSQLRGSHAIAQLSDMVIGVERNQQGENPNVSVLRILKNRWTGETGIAGHLNYDRETGRLVAIPPELAEGPTFTDANGDTFEGEMPF
ncbi:DnaB-like helicase C-terminal domain-containing protein [Inquilinus limosus]|uniref:DnaB-like helicase C-terminal domain-containing protein n=1 Tax=Inquilinus limosus TaxID=171674 RepID=UPI001B7F9ED3|nr:DnaB-like helicase C-terminal domain-containing protein [Inquilinus limosus]